MECEHCGLASEDALCPDCEPTTELFLPLLEELSARPPGAADWAPGDGPTAPTLDLLSPAALTRRATTVIDDAPTREMRVQRATGPTSGTPLSGRR